jgi:hypothetical protein
MQPDLGGDLVDRKRPAGGLEHGEHPGPALAEDRRLRRVRTGEILTCHPSIFSHDIGRNNSDNVSRPTEDA